MTGLNAPQVAELLAEFGLRTFLRGGNPYRAKAYRRAAEQLTALTEPLDRIVAQDRLQEIPGVGSAIAALITTLHATGTHPQLEAMRREFSASALELLKIPGLRPEKVLKLAQIGITSLDDLEHAARGGKLKAVKGLGPALEAKILQSLELMRHTEGQRHIHRAAAFLDALKRNLRRTYPGLTRVEPAGEFRRGCELVSDLAVVAQEKGRKKPERLDMGQGVSVHLTGKAQWGSTLLFATGSAAHLAQLQERAASKGMRLGPEGLFEGRTLVARETEDAIYKALGLSFVPPELREGRGEVQRAAAGSLPCLVEDADIRGILHAHTDRSDGGNTLGQMSEATRSRGYEYFGVADHSRSAHYAGGLSIEEIEAQQLEIEALNQKFGPDFQVFAGIESDILADGGLDYPDEVLQQFDFVVASVHSRFKLDRKTQTERILRAVVNPHTTILGHITGRQLLRRPGYDLDVETVLKACARHQVVVEVNVNPWRLELDWRWHQLALELGCMLAINPDAHSTDEIDLTHWGVVMARKGGVPKERVLNCLGLEDVRRYFAERRAPHRSSGKRRRSTQAQPGPNPKGKRSKQW